ncbi:MAG TPA: heparinase II/III family protein [Longimicrobiales bacterium]|nr:heparinase II/III family protein [Longimicrobiales bacterium]
MKGVLLWLRTVRGLGVRQIVARPLRPLVRGALRHAIQPRSFPPAGDALAAVAATLRVLRPVVESFPDDRGLPRTHSEVAEDAARGLFRFQGLTRDLGSLPDWTARVESRLWTYHLHYFEIAESLARSYRANGADRHLDLLRKLVSSWIDATADQLGDGWDPYPTSTRIVRWVRALALVADDLDPAFLARWVASLEHQARYLARCVEHHVGGNHVVRNYTALILAGAVLPPPTGKRLLRRGRAGLRRQLRRQVLADGVHYERSPMYHALVLEDLLQAVAIAEATEGGRWAAEHAIGRRMASAARVFVRPDGSWHQFGDAAAGHALTPAALASIARAVLAWSPPEPAGVIDLAASGFHGWAEPARRTKFLTRCGAFGAADQPGHAHCDLLSFELWIEGAPVVVDTGVRDYGLDADRSYARSTGAHNTAKLGEAEQAEIWSSFRVGRRPRARLVESSSDEGAYRFRGECRAYHSKALHCREVHGEGATWTIRDRVDRRWRGRVTVPLHLDPSWQPAGAAPPTFVAPVGTLVLRTAGYDEVRTLAGGHGAVRGVRFPAFGVAEECAAVVMTIRANDGRDANLAIRLDSAQAGVGATP